ncbi:hypothetical protein Q8F55_000066 [Vanrija albida]|uniref:F-box domain-containing protein n=1 Tax=Vanrija albida TaxID=181172 RepID=A0ABR3QCT1_9TREE
MAILDHKFYPHIVSLILAECDTPTTIAFRGTSRAFRDAITPALLAHVALYSMFAPVQSHSATRRWISGYVKPSDYPNTGAYSDIDPPVLPEIPAAIRAIDLVVENPTQEWDHYLDSGYRGVRTLRRTRETVFSLPPKFEALSTVVDFAHLYSPLHSDLYVPKELQTYVLHLRWNESERDEIMANITLVHLTGHEDAVLPREMVLVLQPYSPGPAPASTDTLGFLRHIAKQAMWALEDGCAVRIVGVDEVSPQNMGGEGKQDRLKLFKDMLRGFWVAEDEWEHVPTAKKQAALLAKIVFMSTAEWHAGLRKKGGDAYDLQAVWPAYAYVVDE